MWIVQVRFPFSRFDKVELLETKEEAIERMRYVMQTYSENAKEDINSLQWFGTLYNKEVFGQVIELKIIK